MEVIEIIENKLVGNKVRVFKYEINDENNQGEIYQLKPIKGGYENIINTEVLKLKVIGVEPLNKSEDYDIRIRVDGEETLSIPTTLDSEIQVVKKEMYSSYEELLGSGGMWV